MSVVIKEVGYVIVHVPDFVQYGSKPSRDLLENNGLLKQIRDHLRTYEETIQYPPHQVFIGSRHPDELSDIPKPWYEHPLQDGKRQGPFGEIMPEEEFYGWMKIADDFDLLWLEPQFVDQIRDQFASHPFIHGAHVKKLGNGKSTEKIREAIEQGNALPVYFNGKLVGSFRRDHELDDTLKAEVLMENLMAKASGALAMLHLFKRAGITPTDIDFVLDCTETAIGDRYNRGGEVYQRPWLKWSAASMQRATTFVHSVVLPIMPSSMQLVWLALGSMTKSSLRGEAVSPRWA